MKTTNAKSDRPIGRRLLIILCWLALWQAVSLILHNDILLAGPVETILALLRLLPTGAFWASLLSSFVRIVLGFLAGSAAGILLAYLAHRKPLAADILAPLVTALKSIPVASFIILALIWIGSTNLSLFISFVVVFPILYLNTLEGLRSVDDKLVEMAEVYRVPTAAQLRYIYLPALYPFLVSALKLSLGMSWKCGVAAEVIGQPLLSIGNNLYRAKIYLSTSELLAWTVVIVLVSRGFEVLFLWLLKKIYPSAGARSDRQKQA